jgi:hypothetical protein
LMGPSGSGKTSQHRWRPGRTQSRPCVGSGRKSGFPF